MTREEIRKQFKEYYRTNYPKSNWKTVRWQRIKSDREGNPYVTSYGTKYMVDSFMGDLGRYHFTRCISNTICLELVVDDGGDYALLFWSCC